MGNPRNTSGTPVLKQQAGSNSEPISQHSTSSQTEPEEDLSFSADTWLDENDDTNIMKQNYTEAVSFINACHQRVNTTNKNKHPNKTELFLLPMVENFIPMLPYLMGKESEEETVPKNKKRKAKGTFAVKKATDVPPDFIPGNDVNVFYFNLAFNFFFKWEMLKKFRLVMMKTKRNKVKKSML